MILTRHRFIQVHQSVTDMPNNRRRSHDTSWQTPGPTPPPRTMQFSVSLIAMLASMAVAAPGTNPAVESVQVGLPALGDGLGYIISPAEKPETNNSIVKRREGCRACQW
ncbi:hypothetical protein B0T21DRAFT_386529 [Apiosordaria backusii]|uniref:Uncharacterized protein n=1 Tax=Apiosordaria backusii TaxID=314023 RepID=A0AA40AN28_9PEZI|nr:hypothetical protein B0T21DRAFT_386529 [Apiosordaria backusii]